MSRLDLVVGPNGAGKSTFIALALLAEVPDSILVNADEIAAERWPEDQAAHAYEAAAIAEETRTRLLLDGRSFVAETVFSHPSKLELIDDARQRGYRVVLQVVMVPEEVSVARVAARVASGGHDVPEEKVRARWRRLWTNVAAAAELANGAAFWNNEAHDGPSKIALVRAGELIGSAQWPTWAPAELTPRW